MAIRLFDPNQGGVLVVPNWPNSGSPTSGTTGTLAGFTQPGDLLTDTTTGTVYVNTNTSLSPTWTQLGTVPVTSGNLALTGAAGSGAGAGGTQSITGGTGGATGAGGAVSYVGGAGGSSSGTGGAANLTGGVGSAGNANGGSVVITGGAANGSGIAGGVRVESIFVRTQGAPAAKTVSATLTVTELLSGIITVNQGAAGASNLQSPTGTAIQNALPADFATGDSFDVCFINISVTTAEIASLTVNTDVTIVGTAAVAAIAAGVASQGTFRFRKTGNHVFVAYRIH